MTKVIFLIILLAVLAIALIMTWMVRKEQENRIGNKFLKLIRKFDSWQMMR